MKLNLDQPVLDYRGNVIPDQFEKDTNLSLRSAVVHALFMTYNDEQQLSGQEKFKRADLAMRVEQDSGDGEYTVEEVAKMKEIVAKLYGPIIILRVWKMLDEAQK